MRKRSLERRWTQWLARQFYLSDGLLWTTVPRTAQQRSSRAIRNVIRGLSWFAEREIRIAILLRRLMLLASDSRGLTRVSSSYSATLTPMFLLNRSTWNS